MCIFRKSVKIIPKRHCACNLLSFVSFWVLSSMFVCVCVCPKSIVCLLKFSNCLFIMWVETTDTTWWWWWWWRWWQCCHCYRCFVPWLGNHKRLQPCIMSVWSFTHMCLCVCVLDWITMPTHVEHNSQLHRVSVVTLSRKSASKVWHTICGNNFPFTRQASVKSRLLFLINMYLAITEIYAKSAVKLLI